MYLQNRNGNWQNAKYEQEKFLCFESGALLKYSKIHSNGSQMNRGGMPSMKGIETSIKTKSGLSCLAIIAIPIICNAPFTVVAATGRCLHNHIPAT
jgi:hypothetical protein